MSSARGQNNIVIDVRGLENVLGGNVVHKNLDVAIRRQEIIAVIGASGCGKTTLLRSILMLQKPTAGVVKVFGIDVTKCNPEQAQSVQDRWGVMFQSAALFSSLTVLENVMFPLQEKVKISKELQKEIALFKIKLVGLEQEAASKFPSELSGGMKKRVALARALVLDPELIFLDEPAAGLDPKSADDFDSLILHLRKTLGLTFIMVTHDIDTLWRVPDRIIFLGEGRVLAAEPMSALVKEQHPLIRSYFSGPRGKERAVMKSF